MKQICFLTSFHFFKLKNIFLIVASSTTEVRKFILQVEGENDRRVHVKKLQVALFLRSNISNAIAPSIFAIY